jgi:hypothetical protein
MSSEPPQKGCTRLKEYLQRNHVWLGNVAQLTTPIIALVAVAFAWVAQDNAKQVVESTLQEASFGRAIENIRHIADLGIQGDLLEVVV